MALDHSLELRRAVVTNLKGDAALIGLLGGRIYGEKEPEAAEQPFARVGFVLATPRDHACHGGMDASFAVHTFAKGGDAQLIYTINRAISARLHNASLALDGGGWVEDLTWENTAILGDPEPEVYHGVVQFRAVTGEDNA